MSRFSAASPRLQTLLALLLILAVIYLPAGFVAPPAQAQAVVTVTPRPGSGPVGTVFRFHGTGFNAHETVSTVVKWPDGSEEGDVLFQANADGAVDFIWDSRGAVAGRYTATATGADSKSSGNTTFSVQSP